MKWISLLTKEQLDDLVQRSYTTSCLILKHSTTCSISYMAKSRLERDWRFEEGDMIPYYLDLQSHRDLSREIAERFEVYHESPQVLLIKGGVCVYDASHLDISFAELVECSVG